MRTFRSILVTVGVLLLSGCAVPTMTSSSLFDGSGAGVRQGQPQASPGSLPTEQNGRNGQNIQKGDTFAKALGAGRSPPKSRAMHCLAPVRRSRRSSGKAWGGSCSVSRIRNQVIIPSTAY